MLIQVFMAWCSTLNRNRIFKVAILPNMKGACTTSGENFEHPLGSPFPSSFFYRQQAVCYYGKFSDFLVLKNYKMQDGSSEGKRPTFVKLCSILNFIHRALLDESSGLYKSSTCTFEGSWNLNKKYTCIRYLNTDLSCAPADV